MLIEDLKRYGEVPGDVTEDEAREAVTLAESTVRSEIGISGITQEGFAGFSLKVAERALNILWRRRGRG